MDTVEHTRHSNSDIDISATWNPPRRAEVIRVASDLSNARGATATTRPFALVEHMCTKMLVCPIRRFEHLKHTNALLYGDRTDPNRSTPPMGRASLVWYTIHAK